MVTGNGPPFDAEEAEKQEIYMLIGQVILISQIAEQALKACMTFVIQDDDPLTLEKLKSQDQQEKRKTLGYFISKLRRKAEVDVDLDGLLSEYLEKRNLLVHNVEAIPEWNLKSQAGRRVAKQFIERLGYLASETMMIFPGFLRAWQVESLPDVSMPLESERLLQELDINYAPLIRVLLSKKEV
jgi:hypothetical protein